MLRFLVIIALSTPAAMASDWCVPDDIMHGLDNGGDLIDATIVSYQHDKATGLNGFRLKVNWSASGSIPPRTTLWVREPIVKTSYPPDARFVFSVQRYKGRMRSSGCFAGLQVTQGVVKCSRDQKKVCPGFYNPHRLGLAIDAFRMRALRRLQRARPK